MDPWRENTYAILLIDIVNRLIDAPTHPEGLPFDHSGNKKGKKKKRKEKESASFRLIIRKKNASGVRFLFLEKDGACMLRRGDLWDSGHVGGGVRFGTLLILIEMLSHWVFLFRRALSQNS